MHRSKKEGQNLGLNNTQYDAIMRRYNQKQIQNHRQMEEHRQNAYEKIPQLPEIDQQVSSVSLSHARMLLENPELSAKNAGQAAGDARLTALKEQLSQFAKQREALLQQHGFPSNYLDMEYTCPDCQDTGYIGDQKCHCFRQQAIDLFYTQSGMKEVLEIENFKNFSYDYYPEELIHPATGKTARELMRGTVASCLRYIDEFDQTFSNLFFYGGTGLGKTFLSHCIAKELIERSHSVIYYSAFELFDMVAQNSFGRVTPQENMKDYVLDCDLLIIDDLGTELTNSFVSSQLFLILNERIQRKKSTIISTNLSLSAFAETYSERVFSRITSNFQLFQLYGNDIRIQKKLKAIT